MLDRLQVAIDYAIENSPIDRINNSLKKITKVAGATGLALAGMAVKTGLSEAMDLEGFRLTLLKPLIPAVAIVILSRRSLKQRSRVRKLS